MLEHYFASYAAIEPAPELTARGYRSAWARFSAADRAATSLEKLRRVADHRAPIAIRNA